MTQNAACLHVDEHRLSVPLRWNNNCCVKPAPWENFGESVQRCVYGLDPSGVGWQRGQACAHTCYSVDELAGGLLHSYSTASHRRFVLKWQRARSFIISFAAPVMEKPLRTLWGDVHTTALCWERYFVEVLCVGCQCVCELLSWFSAFESRYRFNLIGSNLHACWSEMNNLQPAREGPDVWVGSAVLNVKSKWKT